MTQPTVVYHWWATNAEKPHYSNLAHPVLLSIATLRAVNPTIPIKVIDCSGSWMDEDWLHFKNKLDFSVSYGIFELDRYSHIKGYKLLSRLFDVRVHQTSPVIYCDSDVFWLRDPLPLLGDSTRFCFDGFNSGFFYYDPASFKVKEMFEIFDAYTITALSDQTFCNHIKEVTAYDDWPYIWDETIMTYMTQTGLDHLFDIVPREEHGLIRHFPQMDDLEQLKMLHCNGLMVYNPLAKRLEEKDHSRGLACLLFKEFYDHLRAVLSEDDIKMIFTKAEISDGLAHQISLKDFDKIPRTEDGHFCLNGTFRPTASTWLM